MCLNLMHLGQREVLFVHELCLLIELIEKSPRERTENCIVWFFSGNIMYTFKLRSRTEGEESRCDKLQR